MQEFERASLHKDFVNEENNTGSYIFEPLERGFGITIGNTICRTLLTSDLSEYLAFASLFL